VFFRYDTNVGSDKHVVSDRNLSAVHEFAVDVEKKIIAYRGIVSVSAKKRLLHNAVVSGPAEQFAYRRLPRAPRFYTPSRRGFPRPDAVIRPCFKYIAKFVEREKIIEIIVLFWYNKPKRVNRKRSMR